MAYQQTEYTRKKTEASRNSLMLAALRQFLTKGYTKTTMQEVVREAQTSIGNAYFYFRNKEDLLVRVVERMVATRTRSVDPILEDLPRGPGRLAVNTYCWVLPPLDGAIVAPKAAQAGDSALLDALVAAGIERSRQLLAENLPRIDESRAVFAAHAWAGAEMKLVRARLNGTVQGSADQLAREIARWHLAAMGLDRRIATAMACIDQARGHPAWSRYEATIPRGLSDLGRLLKPI